MKNFILKCSKFFLVIFSILISANPATADEGSKYSEVARDRQYAGGKDESDLKVQAASAIPAKNKPVSEPVDNNEGF